MRLGALLGPITATDSPRALAEQARQFVGEGFESLWSAQAIGRGFMMTDPFVALSVAAGVTDSVDGPPLRWLLRRPWRGGAQTAVYDMLGKATGLPVCNLLSANPHQRILQAYWSHCYPPDMMAKEAQRGASLGYRVHKVKVRPWEDPVAQAQAIFSVTPRDYRVWGDTNHSWGSAGRTLYYARKLAEFPGYFGIESPLRGTEGYRQLKGQVPLRLAEHWGLVDPMLAAREGILDAWITASPAFGYTMFRHNAFARTSEGTGVGPGASK